MNIIQIFSNSNNQINIFLHIVNTINEIHNFGENKMHSFIDLTNIALTIHFLMISLKKNQEKYHLLASHPPIDSQCKNVIDKSIPLSYKFRKRHEPKSLIDKSIHPN